VYQAYYNWQKN